MPGCEAVEAWFNYGPQLCMKAAVAKVRVWGEWSESDEGWVCPYHFLASRHRHEVLISLREVKV